MTKSLNYYITEKVFPYGQKIINECGLSQPPIDENLVLDYLGLQKDTFSVKDKDIEKEVKKDFMKISGFIKTSSEGKSQIYINSDMPVNRQRFTIFHELAHYILPWHKKLNYFCEKKYLSPAYQKVIEKEANELGVELLMPKEMFFEDINSLNISFNSIIELSNKYKTSIESTAIRYTRLHPKVCGLICVRPNRKVKDNDIKISEDEYIDNPKEFLQFINSNSVKKKKHKYHNTEKYPLRTEYYARSSLFQYTLQLKRLLSKENIIFESYNSMTAIKGEIPLNIVGSNKYVDLYAECLPIKYLGKVLVLLTYKDLRNFIF